MNILLVTLDQFRGDCLSALGHKHASTPNLDRLAGEGLLLARHYSQAAPCGPGRASLYTGMYQMNHRVVANGTPLDARFDNVALMARRAGYTPTLFGYTDQAIDPRRAEGPDDPRLQTYEEILPGFEEGVHLRGAKPHQWISWMRAKGYDVPDDGNAAMLSEGERPAEVSNTAFLTGALIDWIGTQPGSWFAHLSHYRPHPPYQAAGKFAQMYKPGDMDAPIAAKPQHPLHEELARAGMMVVAPETISTMRAQYFGMIAEVDHQLGLLWAALERMGQWDDTLIMVTADHGEQLGDHGLKQKGGYFEESYRVLGIVRDPRPGKARGSVLRRFSENVDFFPTLCEALGQAIPAQCDGLALTPLLDGREPETWRDAAHWQFDWRGYDIVQAARGATSGIAKEAGKKAHESDLLDRAVREAVNAELTGRELADAGRALERKNLTVRRDETHAFVHFADGSSLCFDLAADPTWRTLQPAPEKILPCANALLTWRAQHQDRTLTGMLIQKGGIGRWPEVTKG